ncbi:hypothetical protein VaNZ11_001084 [Volvox africanus]|uniref:RRM domain-containing protein n=1 Tax=Volvox africanus TaxID=51714 RepID=A0ABQ5RPK6_9CHLO|nr:hypothetical protein VaNZ11_001084 [Volvox africanus]
MVTGRLAAGTSLGTSARALTGWLETSRELSRELQITCNDACAFNAAPPSALESRRVLHSRAWTFNTSRYSAEHPWGGASKPSGGPLHSPAQQQRGGQRYLHVSSTCRTELLSEAVQHAGGNSGKLDRISELSELSALAKEWRNHFQLTIQRRRRQGVRAGCTDNTRALAMVTTPQEEGKHIPLSLIERTCILLDQHLGNTVFVPAERPRVRPTSHTLTTGGFPGDAEASIRHAAIEDLADIIASTAGCMLGDSRPLPPPSDLVRSLVASATAVAHNATWSQAAKMLQGFVHMGAVGKKYLDRMLSRIQRIHMAPEHIRVPRKGACRGGSARQREAVGVQLPLPTLSAGPAEAPSATARSLENETPSVVDSIGLLRSLSALHAVQAVTVSANIGGAMQRLILHLSSLLPRLPGPLPLLGLLRDVTSCRWRHDREPEFLRRIADYLCTRTPPDLPLLPDFSDTALRRSLKTPAANLDSNSVNAAMERITCDDDDVALARPQHLHALTLSQLVEVLDIYARAGVHHSDLMERGMDAVDRCLPMLLPSQAARVAEACARFSHHRPALMRRLALHVAAHLSLPPPPLSGAGDSPVVPEDVMATVAALTRCRVRDERFLDAAAAYALEHAGLLLAEAQAAKRRNLQTQLGVQLQEPVRAPVVLQDGSSLMSATITFAEVTGSRGRDVLGFGMATAVSELDASVSSQSTGASKRPEQEAVASDTMRQKRAVSGCGIEKPTRMAGVAESASASVLLPDAAARTGDGCSSEPHDFREVGGPQLKSAMLEPACAMDLAGGADDVTLLEALFMPPTSDPPMPLPQLAGLKPQQSFVSSSMGIDSTMKEQEQPSMPQRQLRAQDAVDTPAVGVWPTGLNTSPSDTSVGLVPADWEPIMTAGVAAKEKSRDLAMSITSKPFRAAPPHPAAIAADVRPERMSNAMDSSPRRVSFTRVAPDRTGLVIRRLSPALQPRALLDELLAVPDASIDLYYMPYDYAAVTRGRPGLGCAFVGVTSTEGVAALARRLQAGPVCGGAELAVLEYLPPANSDALLRALLNPASGYSPPRTDTTSRPMLLYVTGSLRGKVQPVEPKDVEIYDMRPAGDLHAQHSGSSQRMLERRAQEQQPEDPCDPISQFIAAAPEQTHPHAAEPQLQPVASTHAGTVHSQTHAYVNDNWKRCPPSPNVATLGLPLPLQGVDHHRPINGGQGTYESLPCLDGPAHSNVQLRLPQLLEVSQLALIAHSMAVSSYHPAGMLKSLGELMRILVQPALRDAHLAAAMLPAGDDKAISSQLGAAGAAPSSSTSPDDETPSMVYSTQRCHNLPALKSVLQTLHALAAQPCPDPIAFSELAEVCATALSAWVPLHKSYQQGADSAAAPQVYTRSNVESNGRGADVFLPGGGGGGGYSNSAAAPAAVLPPPDILDVHVRLLAQTLAAAADRGAVLYHPRLCDVAAALLRHRLWCLRMRAACALLQPLVRLRHAPARQLVAAMAPLLAQDSGRLSAPSLVDLAWSCARTDLRETDSGPGPVVRVLAARTRQLLQQLPTAGVVQMFWALAALGYDDHAAGGPAEAAAGATGRLGAGGLNIYWQLLQVLLQRYDISARDLLLLQEGMKLRRQQLQQQRLRMAAGVATNLTVDPEAVKGGEELMESFLHELLYRAGGTEVMAAAARPPTSVANKLQQAVPVEAALGSNTADATEGLLSTAAGSPSSTIAMVCAAVQPAAASHSVDAEQSCSFTAGVEETRLVAGTGLDPQSLPPLSAVPAPYSKLQSLPIAAAKTEAIKISHLMEGAGSLKDIQTRATLGCTRAGSSTHADVSGEDAGGGPTSVSLDLHSSWRTSTTPGAPDPVSRGGEYVGQCCDERKLDGLATGCSCSFRKGGVTSVHSSIDSGNGTGIGLVDLAVGSEQVGEEVLAVRGLLRQILIAWRGLHLEETGGVLMRLQVPDVVVARARGRATAAVAS